MKMIAAAMDSEKGILHVRSVDVGERKIYARSFDFADCD